jgi:hypothetical protein
MIPQPSRIHLFQGYGVELEYMIVDRDTLAVKPIADELLKYELGRYDSDFENGMVTWSNELVLHVGVPALLANRKRKNHWPFYQHAAGFSGPLATHSECSNQSL